MRFDSLICMLAVSRPICRKASIERIAVSCLPFGWWPGWTSLRHCRHHPHMYLTTFRMPFRLFFVLCLLWTLSYGQNCHKGWFGEFFMVSYVSGYHTFLTVITSNFSLLHSPFTFFRSFFVFSQQDFISILKFSNLTNCCLLFLLFRVMFLLYFCLQQQL